MKGFKIKYISLNNKCKELSKAFYNQLETCIWLKKHWLENTVGEPGIKKLVECASRHIKKLVYSNKTAENPVKVSGQYQNRLECYTMFKNGYIHVDATFYIWSNELMWRRNSRQSQGRSTAHW